MCGLYSQITIPISSFLGNKMEHATALNSNTAVLRYWSPKVDFGLGEDDFLHLLQRWCLGIDDDADALLSCRSAGHET